MSVRLVQTWAMLVDAYRELNYKKLFWITLAISVLVVVAFAAAGINEKGVTILHWQFDTPMLNTSVMSREAFYKTYMVQLGVGVWLGWIAAILALVSTASIFPDFLTGGAIDLWLSRPISRLRLFATKYVFGLLFVTLQVGAFSLACFIVLGVRGGAWEPGLFLAVPLVVCFFSYLFSFCVLFGVLTRSTIAALLLTLLVWFGLFLVNTTEAALMSIGTMQQMSAERTERRIEAQLKRPEPNEERLKQLRQTLEETNTAVTKLEWWHNWAFRAKTLLPKTDETVELLSRKLVDLADLPKPPEGDQSLEDSPLGPREPISQRELQKKLIEQRRGRSVGWVVGTSLLFEGAVVAIAAFIFCRRDY
ncbi:MAG: ABC transporter permease [Phycisphaerales bacterium]